MSEAKSASEGGGAIGRVGSGRMIVDSRAERVTLFEDRAEVVRRASLVVPVGVSWVEVRGVSALVDDPTVVARVRGEAARVIAARVVRRMREEAAGGSSEMADSDADLKTARQRRAAAEQAVSRASAAEARAVELGDRWIAGMGHAPRGGSEAIGHWRAAFHSLERALIAALDEADARRRELARAQLDEARAELRFQAAHIISPRYETAVEVQVEAGSSGDLELELSYRTPCALWRPEHVARLAARDDGKSHEIQLATHATVWQQTGEEWKDVQCRFSTARPAQLASPPRLSDDQLELRRKTEAEQKEVVVEARDQTIAVAGLGRGARSVEEMPGVEDGGEPQWYEAALPVTIPSTGQPFRVEIARATLPCTVERVAFPERSQAVHLRATATLSTSGPLLAGPVRVARGSEIVGRGRVAFVAQGEPFELGFGADDGLRVRRRVDEERDTTAIIGTQKLTRTVHLYLSNLGDEARQLTVTERVPVSEIRDVTIALLSTGGATFDERDGYARFHVQLGAGETRELELAYRVEASAKIRLPF